jgi:hypothetical protein
VVAEILLLTIGLAPAITLAVSSAPTKPAASRGEVIRSEGCRFGVGDCEEGLEIAATRPDTAAMLLIFCEIAIVSLDKTEDVGTGNFTKPASFPSCTGATTKVGTDGAGTGTIGA